MKTIKTKENTHLTLDVEVINRIDRIRGLIPRSTYINDVLKRIIPVHLSGKTDVQAAQHPAIRQGEGK
jgi:hypothetical protein